jgi:soluble lytic murein transglycosylase-like protein
MTQEVNGHLPDVVAALIDQAADRAGLRRDIARAVAWVESRGNQAAIGTSGERGVMQLTAATARELGVDPTDIVQNIDGGVRYLQRLVSQYGETRGIASYNAGPRVAALPDYRWPESTQRYVRLVLERASIEALRSGARHAVIPFRPSTQPTAARPAARRSRSLSSVRPLSPPSSGANGGAKNERK